MKSRKNKCLNSYLDSYLLLILENEILKQHLKTAHSRILVLEHVVSVSEESFMAQCGFTFGEESCTNTHGLKMGCGSKQLCRALLGLEKSNGQ